VVVRHPLTGSWILKEGFSGIFAKLLNTTISYVMSVHLSAWNSLASTGWILTKFDVVGYFLKICRENSSLIKCGEE